MARRRFLSLLASPWRDHAGRFAPLKAAVLVGVLIPALDMAVLFEMNALGGRPVHEMILRCGHWAVRFLLLTLAVTPLRAVLDWPRVLLLRRMLGVTAAAYAVTHLMLYCADTGWRPLFVASEILHHIYLTIGFATLLGLLALAITSTDGWQRRLGRRWKKLHRLVFPLAVLALTHYFLQAKADTTDAVFAAGIFVWLAAWRLSPRRWQGRLALLPALAVLAAILTGLIETAWYGLATHVDAARVLLANFTIAYGPRPSLEILLVTALLLPLAAGRRWWKGRRGKARARPWSRKGAEAPLSP
ncbi:MAG: ferric reductase-like transmembrane domain-containing protein [Rhodospirillales bacterium]|nr:ferric reductase-like transmembrane domain-containing protein [Rhodospirillales bacterium]